MISWLSLSSIPLIQGLPRKLARKRRLGVFLDRVGISHDLALVTGNESLFPVAKLQTILAELNSKVKRKVLVLDIRFAKQRRAKWKKLNVNEPYHLRGRQLYPRVVQYVYLYEQASILLPHFRNRHLTLDPFSTVTSSSQDVQVLSKGLKTLNYCYQVPRLLLSVLERLRKPSQNVQRLLDHHQGVRRFRNGLGGAHHRRRGVGQTHHHVHHLHNVIDKMCH